MSVGIPRASPAGVDSASVLHKDREPVPSSRRVVHPSGLDRGRRPELIEADSTTDDCLFGRPLDPGPAAPRRSRWDRAKADFHAFGWSVLALLYMLLLGRLDLPWGAVGGVGFFMAFLSAYCRLIRGLAALLAPREQNPCAGEPDTAEARAGISNARPAPEAAATAPVHQNQPPAPVPPRIAPPVQPTSQPPEPKEKQPAAEWPVGLPLWALALLREYPDGYLFMVRTPLLARRRGGPASNVN